MEGASFGSRQYLPRTQGVVAAVFASPPTAMGIERVKARRTVVGWRRRRRRCDEKCLHTKLLQAIVQHCHPPVFGASGPQLSPILPMRIRLGEPPLVLHPVGGLGSFLAFPHGPLQLSPRRVGGIAVLYCFASRLTARRSALLPNTASGRPGVPQDSARDTPPPLLVIIRRHSCCYRLVCLGCSFRPSSGLSPVGLCRGRGGAGHGGGRRVCASRSNTTMLEVTLPIS